MDKTVEKIVYLDSIFVAVPVLPSPPSPESNVVVYSKESLIPGRLWEATLNWRKGFSFHKGVVLEEFCCVGKWTWWGKLSEVVLSGIVVSSPHFVPSPCFIPCALRTVRCPQSAVLFFIPTGSSPLDARVWVHSSQIWRKRETDFPPNFFCFQSWDGFLINFARISSLTKSLLQRSEYYLM